MSKKNKLIIIEFLDELKEFLEYTKENKIDISEFLIVSLQPEVAAFCKSNKTNYIDTLPFFNNRSHENVLKKSNELTDLIRKKLLFNLESAIRTAIIDTFIYYSRFYINNFTWIIEIMNGIKKNHEDCEINIFKKNPGRQFYNPGREPFLSREDLFVPSIVEKYCLQNRLKFNTIIENRQSPVRLKQKKRGLPENILKKVAGKLMKIKLKKLSGRQVIFMTTPSYNLDRLSREIKQAVPGTLYVTITQRELSVFGYLKLSLKGMVNCLMNTNSSEGIIIIPIMAFVKKKGGEQPVLTSIKQSYSEFVRVYGEEFRYDNCSFLEELNEKVESYLLDYIYHLHCLTEAQIVILENLKPNLLVSPVSNDIYHNWGVLCKSFNIPALVIPQKGLVVPRNKYAKIEEYYIGRAQVTDGFDYAAAQSPMISDYLNWSGYKGTVIKTGNLIFSRVDPIKRKEKKEEIFKRIEGSKKIIVYAPSMKSRKSRRFFVLETLDELVSSISDIMEAVSDMENVHLIIRIHPGEPISKKEIYSLTSVPRNVSINDEGAFEDILTIADLVISFSSTSIQESLLNYIPVILYDKWKRYNHLDAVKVRNTIPAQVLPVFYIDNKEILSSTIEWIFKNHLYIDAPGDIFKDYVFHEYNSEKLYNFIHLCLKGNRIYGKNNS